MSQTRESSRSPVLGFMLLGGSVNGAQVRDIRLANELHRRGFPVHVWWIVDRPKDSPLDAGIPQKWLCHSFRYATGRVSGVLETMGRLSWRLLSDRARSSLAQRIPWLVAGTLRGLIKVVCDGVEADSRLIRRFAHELTTAGVTHLTGTIEILGCFAEAAREHVPYPLQTLVQFQGYETYAPYAVKLGLEERMYQRIREAAEASGLPSVTCSEPYSKRIEREIGLPASKLKAIAPGVPITNPMERSQALELVRQQFPEFDPDLPLISYLGRRDSEKGIDLLLYAAQILRQRGMTFQLAVCGPTAFGSRYSIACRQIAQILKLPVLSSEYIPGDLRSALFRVSRCVVYPSIHEEPFGMVPVEAMVQGTPVVVSDAGGVAELPFLGKQQAGLVFRSWDSGDLAEQLERILSDSAMCRRFAMAAPQIGAHYSVERMADRFLDHFSLPRSLHQQEEIRMTRSRAA